MRVTTYEQITTRVHCQPRCKSGCQSEITVLLVEPACGETQEEQLFEVSHEIHEFAEVK